MVTKYLHTVFFLALTLGLAGTGFAQVGLGSNSDKDESDKKIRFNGMGRASMQQTNLGSAVFLEQVSL